MGIPIAERYTPSGAASAKRGARGVAQHAAGGVETDLSANIPTHERPEEIAGQRSATHRTDRATRHRRRDADGVGAKSTEQAASVSAPARTLICPSKNRRPIYPAGETMLGSDILRRVRKR